MKLKLVVILSLSALLAGLWYWWPAEPAQAVSIPAAEPRGTTAQATEPQSITSTPQHIEVTEKIPQPISDSFKLLASAYADELSFPAYSRPLTANDIALLQPNRYIVQQVPLEGGASASIVLPKYRFSYPEAIPVTLQISGLTVADVSVQVTDEASASQLAADQMHAAGDNWIAELTAEDDWNGALEISVSFSANGRQQVLKTGIEYSHPVATITGVEPSRSAGSDMLIPVQLEVEQAGYYRLRANLFTAQRQPLAVLTGSEKLGRGSTEIILRVHKGVLAQQSGPFILTTFTLEKRAAAPGELTRYGDSAEAEYLLEHFSLDQLSDAPWQPDEEELQRLQFLQQMSGD